MAEHLANEAVQRSDAMSWLSTQDLPYGLDKLNFPQLIGTEQEGCQEEGSLLVVYKEGKHVRHFGERIFN